MTTVRIETHGCKLNQADSQALTRTFEDSGYKIVGPDVLADVYVLNTCTVTNSADQKARQTIRSARRNNPMAIIAVTGCYAQRSSESLKQLPELDLVFGNTDKHRIVDEISNLESHYSPERDVYQDYYPASQTMNVSRVRAMLAIQEGCNQMCSYCIVPRVRGRERSLPVNYLVAQAQRLEREGYQEVVLTGTQLISYGFDLQQTSLKSLLIALLTETAIPRIRVSSLQPQILDEQLLELWHNPRLCPHFHIPLQSGSDNILHVMKRRYTSETFLKAVENVRRSMPNAAITTDIITGFPGETENDFLQTKIMCEKTRFSDIHVFPYSVRPGTSASYFKNTVTHYTKTSRAKIIADVAAVHSKEFRLDMLNGKYSVLWENMKMVSGHKQWSGLTDTYIRTHTIHEDNLRNIITDAIPVESHRNSLFAKISL